MNTSLDSELTQEGIYSRFQEAVKDENDSEMYRAIDSAYELDYVDLGKKMESEIPCEYCWGSGTVLQGSHDDVVAVTCECVKETDINNRVKSNKE